MSSTLALQAYSAHPPARHHMGSETQEQTGYNSAYGCRGSAPDIFKGGLPTPPASKAMSNLSIPHSNGLYPQQYPQVQQERIPASHIPDFRYSQPVTNGKSNGSEYEEKTQSSTSRERDGYAANGTHQSDQIAPHLQIPDSVNSSKGSIAEFAAEITCLFWFETSATIDYAESLPQGVMPDRGLNPDAIPSIGFRKWVTTILSTTQVGKNVVLLALMFIHRLKKFNRSVSGKKGSEFRLLTIALMLGNKFLDDNTYTNKTWAEVSGISVNEIHIMEVEFLSNMRYELYASREQWREWGVKLGKFGSFYEKALRFVPSRTTSPTTPTIQTIPHKLPSPPSHHKFTPGGYSTLPNPLHTLPQLPRSPVRQLSNADYSFERKRSLDTSLDLPPAKRLHSSFSSGSHFSPSAVVPDLTNTPLYDSGRLPQLPMPSLSNGATRPGNHLTPLALPGSRIMNTGYPVTTGFSQPVTPVNVAPPNLPHPQMTGIGGANPVSRAPSHTGSTHTSPTNMYGTTTPTRPGLSPSYFLMNRSSPYRPVRHVNTLLYPPPSGALQNPIQNIGYEQMQYQTLSKGPNQLRPGPMPSVPAMSWASNASTPSQQPYRPY